MASIRDPDNDAMFGKEFSVYQLPRRRQKPQMTTKTPNFRSLCADLADAYLRLLEHVNNSAWLGYEPSDDSLLQRTRAELALPQPPADGEVADLVEWLEEKGHLAMYVQEGERYFRAAELLEHLALLQPIPVAERLPGERDCAPWDDCEDLDPWCWVGLDGDGGWEWEQRSAADLQALPAGTHWLPAHALPLPGVEATK